MDDDVRGMRDEGAGVGDRVNSPVTPSGLHFIFLMCRLAAQQIQRVVRGHFGRKRVDAKRVECAHATRATQEEYYASEIQRVFRGYWSRRFVHDFYGIQRYMQALAARSAALRQDMNQYEEEQAAKQAEEREKKARSEFAQVTQGLHHLLSTKAQRGVFQPGFARTPEEMPTAFGLPVEEHLRSAAHTFLRTHGVYREDWPSSRSHAQERALRALRDVGGSNKEDETEALAVAALPEPSIGDVGAPSITQGLVPLQQPQQTGTEQQAMGATESSRGGVVSRGETYLGSRRSLRACEPYGREIEVQRTEQRYSRLRELDSKPFLTAPKPKPPGYVRSISANDPYIPQYKREEMMSRGGLEKAPAVDFRTDTRTHGLLFEDHERQRLRRGHTALPRPHRSAAATARMILQPRPASSGGRGSVRSEQGSVGQVRSAAGIRTGGFSRP